MKYYKTKLFLFSSLLIFSPIMKVNAEEKKAVLKDAVYLRKGPGTNYGYYILGKNGTSYTLKKETVIPDEPKNGNCNAGWYEINYDAKSAYVCASFVEIKDSSTINVQTSYNRPWTSPKKAIVGGAEFISSSYINKGQFTSYLKKFNVNPNSSYSVYNHQYMANLAAPYSEAYTSYKTYKENKLLELPLEFTIPIFENMPEYTALPGKEPNKVCESTITDAAFEEALDEQGFPESYKCKLRELHKTHANWTFKALKTNLDFAKSVNAEQNVSSIQGGSIYYDTPQVQTEKGWYRANKETVGYYLDPRNFLIEERILMFENLAYSDNYTEEVVKTILKNTFMSDLSILDNQTFSSIFVEAGKEKNISAVYLASLAIQEIGTKVSNITSGNEFTYEGVTYKGVYNFFNIGAYSSASNPALAGLVYASGGAPETIVSGGDNNTNNDDNNNSSSSEGSAENGLTESAILAKINASTRLGCLENISLGTTISALKSKLTGLNVTVNASDNDIVKTGQIITITSGDKTYKYTIVIKGDVDGDGKLGATDYVKIKNYIMEKSNSELSTPESLAADVDGNGAILATDYVKIKNSIME